MLTRALTRVPQEDLTGKIMAGMKDGEVADVTGEPLEWEAHAPVRDELHQTIPPGLSPTKGGKLDLPAKSRLDSIRQKALALGGRLAKRSLDRINRFVSPDWLGRLPNERGAWRRCCGRRHEGAEMLRRRQVNWGGRRGARRLHRGTGRWRHWCADTGELGPVTPLIPNTPLRNTSRQIQVPDA